MRIQTFSIVAGSEACNARCPFCVSKMTPPQGVSLKEPAVNWRNFGIACNLAKQSGVSTAMITSKGEPTLFPDQITKYLEHLRDYNFPLIEIQTNGIPLAEREEKYEGFLKHWFELGLTTIAISIVHYDPEKNREIYLPHKSEYIDLPILLERLHDIGFSIRFSAVLLDKYLDSESELQRLIEFAKLHSVEQLTVRPVNKPQKSRHQAASSWVDQNYLREESLREIQNYLTANGVQIMRLVHGATVYDVNGQNVCLTNSLTLDSDGSDIRQLIFFPDGHLRYDWQYAGALLL